MKFTETNLPENILESLKKLGYESMTPVQEATYPIIFEGKDLCALAETGSGKTAACAIPLVAITEAKQKTIQSVVVVPTRELCQQYVSEIGKIADKTGVVSFAIFGGFSKDIQAAKLRHGVHILVATPGRLIDFLRDGTVDLSSVRTVILDEADELLNEGFQDDIEFILSCIIQDHQTLLFSATMPGEIKLLTEKYLKTPDFIELIDDNPAPDTIEHCFKVVETSKKTSELMDYLKNCEIEQALIFCNSKLFVNKLHHMLKNEFPGVEYIHSGLTQMKRSSLFWAFRKKKIRILIATDVAGRGLDFSNVSHVINLDFPGSGEHYTHRTGRTGRMGREGTALTFVTRRDFPGLKRLFAKADFTPIWLGEKPDLSRSSRNKGRTGGNRNSKFAGKSGGPGRSGRSQNRNSRTSGSRRSSKTV